MKTTPLVFDYQSSTPCSTKVIEAMSPYWDECWGNASSRQNHFGIHASAAISFAREQLGNVLKIAPERLIFTSGATESNNLALLGHARSHFLKERYHGHLITLATEHHSVLEPIEQLKREGFTVTTLTPNVDGIVSLNDLIDAFQDDTFLVSIMVANNEIGVIQPIKEIASLCKSRGIKLHSDATQAMGNISLDIDDLGIDLLSISGHKIYGPKGIGLLVKSYDCSIQPLQLGGGQENGLRAGTLPVPLIVGLSSAIDIATSQLDKNSFRLKRLRDHLWEGLQERIPDLILNGSFEQRLPNNLNFTILGVNGSLLHKKLRAKLACSSGSACSNGSPSHVLMSLGRTMKEAESSLRLSLGRKTNSDEVKLAIDLITKVVEELRN